MYKKIIGILSVIAVLGWVVYTGMGDKLVSIGGLSSSAIQVPVSINAETELSNASSAYISYVNTKNRLNEEEKIIALQGWREAYQALRIKQDQIKQHQDKIIQIQQIFNDIDAYSSQISSLQYSISATQSAKKEYTKKTKSTCVSYLPGGKSGGWKKCAKYGSPQKNILKQYDNQVKNALQSINNLNAQINIKSAQIAGIDRTSLSTKTSTNNSKMGEINTLLEKMSSPEGFWTDVIN